MRMITSARISTWRWQTAYASILSAILKLMRTEKGFALTIRREVSAGFITPTRSAAVFLARTYSHTKNESYFELAQKAMQYTAQYQRTDGSWYYAEKADGHWVDNFHTGYVLDCFKHYAESTNDHRFDKNLRTGYEFWKKTFFLPDGTPRYYHSKTLPLDIQCSSQAIDTLVFFSDYDPEALPLAQKVARWTIANMQDKSGYFYYRRYSRSLVNKTATLHWGQATMFCALGGLYKAARHSHEVSVKRKILIIVENAPVPTTHAYGRRGLRYAKQATR